MLLLAAASTPAALAHVAKQHASDAPLAYAQGQGDSLGTPVTIPTVAIPQQTVVSVPTVSVPQSTPATIPTITIPKNRGRGAHHRRSKRRHASGRRTNAMKTVSGQWILAYLTSYCPASAGPVSSSGSPVFWGMLANNFYAFGTRVYIPVIGMTGIVEDRSGSFTTWNHFDVWSPVCYGTPTGYFKVAVQAR
ncbi:MAG: hypothetical protein ACR2JC_16395 [Chloroflexota bacterium]|nr:MAG: hypothetical protein DLM70_02510 [Chloroflexota bacterium]